MANTIIKAEQIVEAALLLLQRSVVLPRTVWRQADADFMGAKDDTITLRVPAVLTAETRTMRANTALSETELTETSVDVTLDTHVYKLLKIRDEELTLDVKDFVRQVLNPQVRSVAEGCEDVIAAALQGANIAAGQTVAFVEGTDEPYDVAVNARRELNVLNVPMADRFLVLGANVEAAFLKSDKLSKVNEAGTPDALRDATLTRVAGFTVLGSNALDPDEGFAYHRTAVGYGNVAPQVPEGATMGSRQSSEGFAMRYLRDYNPTATNGPVDRSLVDAFVGAASVEEGETPNNNRLVAIDFTPEGS